jgi:hypothetical protein
LQVGDRTGLNGDELSQASRLVAKVDSAAVQDGYDLYLHAFIVAANGQWAVVQQGMNERSRQARRYHWLSEHVTLSNGESFLDSPHSGIEGRNEGAIVNLADARAKHNREAEVALVLQGPDRTLSILKRLRERASRNRSLALDLFPAPDELPAIEPEVSLPHLHMPAHHEVRASDVLLRRLHGTLAAAADRGPKDFAALLMLPGVGARTIESLAMVAEVIHGAPSRFTDPARFSFAHGGKDRHPFPVPLDVYDQTLHVLKNAVANAKLGNADRLSAIQRLDRQARALEPIVSGPCFDDYVAREQSMSHQYGGRSVFGMESAAGPVRRGRRA